jgi:hypothetical protein
MKKRSSGKLWLFVGFLILVLVWGNKYPPR